MLKALLLIVATTLLLSAATNSQQHNKDIVQVSTEIAAPSQDEDGDDTDDTDSAQDANEKYVEAGLAVANVVAALIGIASGPIGGILAAGIAIIGYFLTELTKKKTTLWQQIETKVELKIGEALVMYHVEIIKAQVFRVLEDRYKQDTFTYDDLRVVLDKRHLVFPHNFPSLGWSYELPLGILYYMPFVITGYQQLAAKGEVDNCALPNEMTRLRANIITSMKEMMRKRYKQLHGTKYSYERVDCKKKKSKKSLKKQAQNKTMSAAERRSGSLGSGGGKKHCVSIDRLMTWGDGLSAKGFTIRKRFKGWVGNDFNAEVNKIKTATVDFLWKEVVEKVNKYFDPTICFSAFGCTCPEKIQRSEIEFGFPKSCWANGNTGECLHPCDSFDYSYDWCWINQSPDQWSKCTQPDLGDCMTVSVPPIEYPNVLPAKESRIQPEEAESDSS